jgi:hypothetical protein
VAEQSQTTAAASRPVERAVYGWCPIHRRLCWRAPVIVEGRLSGWTCAISHHDSLGPTCRLTALAWKEIRTAEKGDALRGKLHTLDVERLPYG